MLYTKQSGQSGIEFILLMALIVVCIVALFWVASSYVHSMASANTTGFVNCIISLGDIPGCFGK